jgi:AcrR family transcriptional regulator
VTRARKKTPPTPAAKIDGYHHGDLRRALLDEALKVMRHGGPEALSFRDLARRLGVTYGAPHHHFAEKDDLFAAIAEQAFIELTENVQRRIAEATPESPTAALRIMARVYLEFAMSERARYQVMFLPQLRDRKRFASLHDAGGQSLQVLAATFALAGVEQGRAKARAVACWSTLHGFALLANGDFLDETTMGPLPRLVEEMVATAANPATA